METSLLNLVIAKLSVLIQTSQRRYSYSSLPDWLVSNLYITIMTVWFTSSPNTIFDSQSLVAAWSLLIKDRTGLLFRFS